MKAIYDPVVTVCSRCHSASCWQGEFMCYQAYEANIVPRKVSTLIRRHGHGNHEHPDWWNRDLDVSNRRHLTVNDLKALGISEPGYLELA